MKRNANTLRTEEAIARFGKAAWHPLCQAWLRLREEETEYKKVMKDLNSFDGLPNAVRLQKEQSKALLDWLYKEGKQKEAIQADALYHRLDEHLVKVQECYQAQVKLCAYWKEFRDQANLTFCLERRRAESARDAKALKALQYLKKNANRNMSDGQERVLGILRMLRDKTFKATFAKNGVAAAYWEAGSAGDRPLSDEFWQGRFTVMEFRSGLEAMYGPRVAGDKEGKETRRTLKALGIQPAKDQVGRKWKQPITKKQEPKRPRGRPRIHPELEYTDDIDRAHPHLRRHRVNTTGYALNQSGWWRSGKKFGNTSYGGLSSWAKSARKDLAAIDREIAKLELLRGGRKGKFVY